MRGPHQGRDLTFGVCDLTFPARARDPCTLPMVANYGSLISGWVFGFALGGGVGGQFIAACNPEDVVMR